MNRKIFLFCLLLALATCQAATPAAPTPTLTPAPSLTPIPSYTPIPSLTPTSLPPSPTPTPISFAAKTKVGDFEMAISCLGTGEPTIILENGLDFQSWTIFHLQAFASITRTCVYPRVGMTAETFDPPGPRTTLDQVKELHALLQQTGVPGPYILVGHSVAGFNLVLYTDQYPDEVVGLVCVDCRYASFDDIFHEKLKPEVEADPSFAEKNSGEINYWMDDPNPENPDAWKDGKERQDRATSAKQVLAVTSLGNRPIVVLVQETLPQSWQPGNPIIAKALIEAWQEMSIELSKLSTQSRVEILKGTTHLSILYDPTVAKAIQEVYDKVK